MNASNKLPHVILHADNICTIKIDSTFKELSAPEPNSQKINERVTKILLKSIVSM